MDSLVCTVKSAIIEGDTATCRVFVLCGQVDLVGKHLIQNREGQVVGSWRVDAQGAEWVLTRQEGPDLEQCDYMYGELPVTEPPPPSRTQFGHYLVFEGKNWKLAAEKKWREKMVDVAAYEAVGETTLRGKPHIVLKGPDCFAAVRKEVTDADERSGDGNRVASEGGAGVAEPGSSQDGELRPPGVG
jgi:hypothetical protein